MIDTAAFGAIAARGGAMAARGGAFVAVPFCAVVTASLAGILVLAVAIPPTTFELLS